MCTYDHDVEGVASRARPTQNLQPAIVSIITFFVSYAAANRRAYSLVAASCLVRADRSCSYGNLCS